MTLLRKQAPAPQTEEQAVTPTETDTEKAERLKAETDALLDDIDEALGENAELAEQFVAAYQQKGGE